MLFMELDGKTAGRDQSSVFFMYSSIILYELMCGFGLASLPKESQQSMCFWGGSGENWLTELLLMRLERSLCLKEP